MKRVWIDKQPGDYGRPLGVPEIEWRIYLLMRVQILEIWYTAQGTITKWQHGAVHNRGLATCWSELVTRVLDHEFIYEFDLKGFFDRVKTERTLEELGDRWQSWANEVNQTKPMKYKLPPAEKDKAYQEIKRSTTETVKEFGVFENEWKVTETHGIKKMGDEYVKHLKGIPDDLNLAELSEADIKFYNSRRKVLVFQKYRVIIKEEGPVELYEGKPEAIEKYVMDQISRLNELSPVQPIIRAEMPYEREEARDKWKHLGQGTGVAQGANTSPFLATLALHKAVGEMEGLIMYMDDGLIYAKTEGELESRIEQFKKAIARIGLELEEKKSGMVKAGGEMIKPMKFLGIETTDGITLRSKTRSGTQEEFKRPISEQEFVILMAKEGVSTSMAKIAHWELKKLGLLERKLNFAIENKVFPSLISEAFAPGGKRETELKGLMGALKMKIKMEGKPGLMKGIPNELLYQGIGKDHGIYDTTKVALTTISTRACEALTRVVKRGTRIKALNS